MGYQVHLDTRVPQPAAVVRGHVLPREIGDFLGGAFEEVMNACRDQGRTPAGPPFGRYQPTGDGGFDVEAGLPVDRPVEARGRVAPTELPGGPLAHATHTGPYAGVGAAHTAVADWVVGQGGVVSGAAWESYLDGPEASQPRTEVFLPCTLTTPDRG